MADPKAAPIPPQNLDAEESVLGAMMLSAAAIDACSDVLAAPDFYRASHGVIYDACLALHAQGEPVDAITVADRLDALDKLAEVGGKERIHEIASLVPATSNASHYAGIVREMAVLRELITAGEVVQRLGWDRPGPTPELLAEAERAVFALTKQRARGEFVTSEEVAHELIRRLDELSRSGREIVGLPTGFREIDRMTSGLHPGNLVVIAGRPSMGKGLRPEASVLTPAGWRRNIDLLVGDEIIGADGKADIVTGVYDRGVLDFYRVKFSDGSYVECSSDHLWLTRTRNERRRGAPGSVRDTLEILSTLKRQDSPNAANHSVPFVKPVSFAKAPPLPLEPYWLGLYLGDGDSSGGVRFTNPEPDLLEWFSSLLPESDKAKADSEHGCPRITVIRRKRNNQVSESLAELRRLGLAGLRSHEKFIPETFLTARFEERVALLQGICDTDGYVTDPKGACVEVSTSSPRLRDGLVFLVGSLGGRATFASRPSYYTVGGVRHEAKESHRIVLSFPNGGVIPVRSAKHIAKWRCGPHSRGRERMIESVEPAMRGECRCITVGRGLYVTDGFIVTHNSGFAFGVAANVALSGLPVALFTFEMSRYEVMQRLLSLDALVPSDHLNSPSRLTGEDWKRVYASSTRLAAAPLFIEDSRSLTMMDVRSQARRLKARHPALALIIVDYIQLMESGASRFESRNLEVGQISRSLKLMAGELDVPVIALSQLGRDVEKRHDRRPILSDLRDSGAIEQDADVVLLLYRGEYYFPEDEELQGLAEIDVAKQRNGPTGMRKHSFVNRYARFSDLPLPGMAGSSVQ